MAEQMIGKRIDRTDDSIFAPGEFGKHSDGNWHGCTPNDIGANLSNHTVTEHEDGTITVQPSIECGSALKADGDRKRIDPSVQPYWHGFLERGVWREC